jgi:hypothetical protein
VRPIMHKYDVIGIDEGQFFPDVRWRRADHMSDQFVQWFDCGNVLLCLQLVDFCTDAANAGIVVIVAALDGTFEKRVRCFMEASGRDCSACGS